MHKYITQIFLVCQTLHYLWWYQNTAR